MDRLDSHHVGIVTLSLALVVTASGLSQFASGKLAGQLTEVHYYSETQSAEGVTIYANAHNFVRCESGSPIIPQSLGEAVAFRIYEFTGDEPPFDGRIYVSDAMHPVGAVQNFTTLGLDKTYYISTTTDLLFNCLTGFSEAPARPSAPTFNAQNQFSSTSSIYRKGICCRGTFCEPDSYCYHPYDDMNVCKEDCTPSRAEERPSGNVQPNLEPGNQSQSVASSLPSSSISSIVEPNLSQASSASEQASSVHSSHNSSEHTSHSSALSSSSPIIRSSAVSSEKIPRSNNVSDLIVQLTPPAQTPKKPGENIYYGYNFGNMGPDRGANVRMIFETTPPLEHNRVFVSDKYCTISDEHVVECDWRNKEVGGATYSGFMVSIPEDFDCSQTISATISMWDDGNDPEPRNNVVTVTGPPVDCE